MKALRAAYGDSSERVLFHCPGCNEAHYIDPTVWSYNGDSEAPTIRASVLVKHTFAEEREDQVCHSFVTDGNIEFLGDCTHKLAGKTVPLPDIPQDTVEFWTTP